MSYIWKELGWLWDVFWFILSLFGFTGSTVGS